MTNVATTVVSCVLDGDDGAEIAFQAVASGALAKFCGSGTNYDGVHKNFIKNLAQEYDKYIK
ncbi:hypothetical protein RFX70_21840, partial [Acinetobacter baumannii]|nr:hypothetical protein [Acinetobacter baumannii]